MKKFHIGQRVVYTSSTTTVTLRIKSQFDLLMVVNADMSSDDAINGCFYDLYEWLNLANVKH
jgi:hypothetical protein